MILFNKSEKGQTIIEAMVALSSAIIIVSAITIVVINALNNSQYSKNQNLATQYAQEGMEIVRRIRDADWNTFSSYNGQYCLDKSSTSLIPREASIPGCASAVGQSGKNVDPFSREVVIDKNSSECNEVGFSDVTKATVIVGWSDNKCTNVNNPFCHEINLVSCFSNYNLMPSP